MPCPHCKITIIKRSNNESAVSAAAYQSGEKLFSDYDQEQKYYPYKNEVAHKGILLPPHAPPEYADRNTLWNSAEAQEKQWNSQLARRFVLAIPREIPPEQHADLIRDYCREFFVSKGMIADFAIHDKGDGNPHAHILLTMRAMDEKGKWLPKCRKVYDLDGNGERIRLPSGRWKSHKENTVDWNDRKYAEIWRQGWADTANRYLEANNRPERLDLRSYARQGIDKIPTVHMGPAACQMEKKGIQTNIGNLNRDIKAANSLMQSIRQMVRHLKGWIADLKEKKAALMEALEQTKEPTIPELLSQYLELRSGQRADWTSRGVNNFMRCHRFDLVRCRKPTRFPVTGPIVYTIIHLPVYGSFLDSFLHSAPSNYLTSLDAAFCILAGNCAQAIHNSPFTGIVFRFCILFADHTVHYILDQPCVIMLVRAHTVRQFIMEPPAFITAASKPPDQVTFLPSSRNFMHPFPAVPVFQGAPAAWADTFFFTVD